MFSEKETPRYQRMLESELERTISWLKTSNVDSQEYAKVLNNVETLEGMMEKKKPSSISKETLVTVGANLLGIILIISHEQIGNAVTSKALNFVLRPKI